MKINVSIIQQSVWKMEVQSVPLAAGYLKAYAEEDENIRNAFNIKILNFNISNTNKTILKRIFEDSAPDILCFSVQGWNIKNYINICRSYKEIKPNGVIILGGPHVSFQAEKIFSRIPYGDIIINSEGEITFRELLRSYSGCFDPEKLLNIEGISFKYYGRIITTERRKLIDNLDTIPSPYLNGTIPLKDKDGKLLYDCILLETNRGCPFLCAYCNWAGLTGTRIRFFSIQRLQEELIFFAGNKVENLVLCDSNFGLSKEDEAFIDMFIKVRKEYGYPKNIETSWARDPGEIMFRILKKLSENGIKKSFSVSLQSLNEYALRNINRKSISLDHVKKIAAWAKANNMDFFVELIWCLPGETIESFSSTLNDLSVVTKRIAVYPLIILPNSPLDKERDKYELITINETCDDFEYVISNASISIYDNFQLTRHIFWIRIFSENMLFRNIWSPLAAILDLKLTDIVKLFDGYMGQNLESSKINMMSMKLDIHNAIPEALDYIYSNLSSFKEIIKQWWEERILVNIPGHYGAFLKELIEYELYTLPMVAAEANTYNGVKKIVKENECYYLIEDVLFSYDFQTILKNFVPGSIMQNPEPILYNIYYKAGFENYMFNQEFVGIFLGRPVKSSKNVFRKEQPYVKALTI